MTRSQVSQVEVVRLAREVAGEARACFQRRALVLSGEADWCRRTALTLCNSVPLANALWLSSQAPQEVESVAGHHADELLGQERDALVVDAHSGFDVDAFGIVSGIVRGGGLLVLLAPPLETWPQFADPACESIAVAPYTFADVGGRFLGRLVKVIESSNGITVIRQYGPLPSHTLLPSKPVIGAALDAPYRSDDQRRAVEAVVHVMHGHRRRPAVLIADRGRGKSAALGIAAAQLLAAGIKHIVVTAPRSAAVAPLFARAQALLPQAQLKQNRISVADGVLEFRPPDELCQAAVAADLLLVDEAAAIPTSLLEQLLERYSRIAFATTVHGYEGTGRGFAVRFRRVLDERTPGWAEVRLQQPIRWASGDPVEAFVFRALLLDAESAADAKVAQLMLDDCDYVCLDRDELAEDEETLSQLFGLLVAAHYRTRPVDLRNLLDGPKVSVYVVRNAGKVLAAALVTEEGGFDAETTLAVAEGRRRPRGHLIPQSLAAHAGLLQAAQIRCARIMRIAVHPAAQRQGVGARLVAKIRDDALSQGIDYVGASFGATEELMAFWHNVKWCPVRVGFSRDHASGSHSVMVLQALTPAGREIYTAARARFVAGLPHWLSDPLRALESRIVVSLLRRDQPDEAGQVRLSKLDEDQLRQFAHGTLDYSECMRPLWELCVNLPIVVWLRLSHTQRDVLVTKVLQKRSWSDVAAATRLTGRAEAMSVLRGVARELLNYFSDQGLLV